VLHRLLGTLRNPPSSIKVTFLTTIALDIKSSFVLTDLTCAVRSFAWRCLQPLLLSALHCIAHWLRPLVLRTPASVVDTEAQPLGQSLSAVVTNQPLLKLDLPDTPISCLEAPSIKWLETSTDPGVFLAAANLVLSCSPVAFNAPSTLLSQNYIRWRQTAASPPAPSTSLPTTSFPTPSFSALRYWKRNTRRS
jgi:hypothetical protein